MNLGNKFSGKSKSQGISGRRVVTESDLEWCDAVLVNGEGSGTARYVFDALSRAHAKGKKAYLVNTIWKEKVPSMWEALIPHLDEISTRGVISLKNVEAQGAKDARWFLDFSYFASIDEKSIFYDFEGASVLGDFYEYEEEAPELEKALGDMPRLPMIPHSCDWSYFIKSLRSAELYVTGRHHGMYAACKARTPFVLYKREGHKLQDLLDSAKVSIPIPENKSELLEAIEWTRQNRDVYDRLFDWMETQEEWPGFPAQVNGPSPGWLGSRVGALRKLLPAKA